MPTTSSLRVAVICSSIAKVITQVNRRVRFTVSDIVNSFFCSKQGFHVKSYGTGDKVKLPGPAPDKPNCYEFGITYDEIYQDLLAKDKTLYPFQQDLKYEFNTEHCFSTPNGLLHMLDRNKRIKPRPERFQAARDKFDILVTCEERVYDQVIEALESRTPTDNSSVHVINIDIQDNHEEATLGAFLICELMTLLSESDDLDNDIDELLHDFELKCERPILHCVLFY
ncbi:hypothetical protein Cfor_05663 [Coptotermes formosanus]|uniref:RNA polymerase II subunit A C-terminal domain phosphatase SSU72 n=1 Tax=Coptotermes formosanus TaxID=36987 RepID=A0A6L2P8K4_COPFO|nr:hypothetical protein Cfor_05663 [Coptotermes formosanus]